MRKPLPAKFPEDYRRHYPDDYSSYDGTVRWFGDPWPTAEFPAPVCHPLAYVPDLPAKALCAFCTKPLNVRQHSGIGIPGTNGYYWYDLDCWFGTLGLNDNRGQELIPPD